MQFDSLFLTETDWLSVDDSVQPKIKDFFKCEIKVYYLTQIFADIFTWSANGDFKQIIVTGSYSGSRLEPQVEILQRDVRKLLRSKHNIMVVKYSRQHFTLKFKC